MKFVFEQVCYYYADLDNVSGPKLISPLHKASIDKLIEGDYIAEKRFKDKDGIKRTGYTLTKKGFKTAVFADIYRRTKKYYQKKGKTLELSDICKKVEQIAKSN